MALFWMKMLEVLDLQKINRLNRLKIYFKIPNLERRDSREQNLLQDKPLKTGSDVKTDLKPGSESLKQKFELEDLGEPVSSEFEI